MKFKVGDKVTSVDGARLWHTGVITEIDTSNVPYRVQFSAGPDDWYYKAESNLELVPQQVEPNVVLDEPTIRTPMKFKVGDKVKVIECGSYFIGKPGEIVQVKRDNTNSYLVRFGLGSDDCAWKAESDLELVRQQVGLCAASVEPAIRTFETGATRDMVANKLSYMKALSPEVLEAYVMYLDKHRLQPDGTMREFDNWKKGIDKQIYFDSLLRHNHAAWMLTLGHVVSDNHGPVTLLDTIMAIIFNATGLAYELLVEEGKAKRCVQPS